MLPIIPKPPLTAKQKRAALAAAGVIDFAQICLLPALLPGYALDTLLDVAAAIILVAICGFKWQFAVAFTMELFPIVDLFPTWTAVVVMLGASPDVPPIVRATPTAPPLQARIPPRPVNDPNVVDVEAVSVPPVRPPSLPSPQG